MKFKLVLVLIILLGAASCTIPKEARMLKKNTKEWRESSIVLEGYADSPWSGSFLTLRENGKFEHTSSGMLMSFETGMWTNDQDTITLSYVNIDESLKNEQKVLLDRTTSTLIFIGSDTPPMFRLRIIVNRL